ncbi:MAG: hypothetical protein LBQ12_09265, partial [Deltaproteobacteria bacterium]|nr:hypothetical protein [Deltaproteobacteria bacterium]
MIVEFLEDNLFVDGWAADAGSGGKFEVLAGGRSIRLHPKRVLVSSDTADPGTPDGRRALVAAADAARALLAAEVDLEILWGLLEEEQAELAGRGELAGQPDLPELPGQGGQGGTAGAARPEKDAAQRMPHSSDPAARFAYQALAELQFGPGASPDHTSAVMRAVHHEGTFFKFTPEAALKRSREEISHIHDSRAREARRAELRREWIAWLSLARVAYYGAGPQDVP